MPVHTETQEELILVAMNTPWSPLPVLPVPPTYPYVRFSSGHPLPERRMMHRPATVVLLPVQFQKGKQVARIVEGPRTLPSVQAVGYPVPPTRTRDSKGSALGAIGCSPKRIVLFHVKHRCRLPTSQDNHKSCPDVPVTRRSSPGSSVFCALE